MDYNKPFNFLKKLPPKLNSFYKTKSKSGLVVSNKSKSKKDFDPVTNFDRAFEKYIRSLINRKFPKDSIIGEEFEDKFSSNNYKWSIDPIDGTRAFVIGAPTWSNLISLSFEERSLIGLDNLVDLIIHCIDNNNASGNTFLVSDEKDLSTPDLLRVIASSMGISVSLFPLPLSLLKFFGFLLGRKNEIDRLNGSLQIDNSYTKKTLNWKPTFSIEESIRRMVQGK